MLNRRTLGLAALACSMLWACTPNKPAFKSIDITGADYAQGFSLSDQDGQVRTLKDFAGKTVVVFFGFTQCPDVCPTALQEIAQAKQLLGADGAKLQGIFITVDPERDTPELLKAYVANFGADFVALRPSPEQLPKVTKDFKIYYKKVDGKTPTSYTMDHSATIVLLNPKAEFAGIIRPPLKPEAIGADLIALAKARP